MHPIYLNPHMSLVGNSFWVNNIWQGETPNFPASIRNYSNSSDYQDGDTPLLQYLIDGSFVSQQ